MMPLGMEVGLGPGRLYSIGPSYAQKKGTPTPPTDIVLDGVAAPKRGTFPSFRFMSIVAKRLDG